MAAPQIPEYTGEIPQRTQSPSEFSANADSWLAYQLSFIPGANDISAFVNSAATQAETAAQAASTAVESLNFVGEWSLLTGSLDVPSLVLHNDRYWQLLVNVPDVTAVEPGVSPEWTEAQQNGARLIAVAPATLVLGGQYYITGTGTITLPDPTTLSDGVVFNITREPSAEPTITTPITGGISTRLGTFDDLVMDTSQIELVVNGGVYAA